MYPNLGTCGFQHSGIGTLISVFMGFKQQIPHDRRSSRQISMETPGWEEIHCDEESRRMKNNKENFVRGGANSTKAIWFPKLDNQLKSNDVPKIPIKDRNTFEAKARVLPSSDVDAVKENKEEVLKYMGKNGNTRILVETFPGLHKWMKNIEMK
eukprot:Gb_11472 [translate_table: standard]